jgi:hypothetical protein
MKSSAVHITGTHRDTLESVIVNAVKATSPWGDHSLRLLPMLARKTNES